MGFVNKGLFNISQKFRYENPGADRLPHKFSTLEAMISDDLRRKTALEEFSKTQSILWLAAHADFARHILLEFEAGRTDTRQIFLVRPSEIKIIH